MSFNDDEEPLTRDVAGKVPEPLPSERAKLKIISKMEAPLDESVFKVMLELTGEASGNERPGLDLVTVLDLSGSMSGDKLAKTKDAVHFVIKKLGTIDRLSVVTYSGHARRLCPLVQMTANSKTNLENLVSSLLAGGNTNIAEGLLLGIKVLDDRRFKSGRVAGIMLMSDGEQNRGDATQVLVGSVPVFTFGFGPDCDPRVLKAIADNSMGGTYSDVRNTDNLSIAFSQCLAGLLTVVVQDLKLTIKQVDRESTIERVSAGKYPQLKGDAVGSVTIFFGDLYDKEIRKLIVDLSLPFVSTEASADILQISYTYSIGKELFDVNPLTLNIMRNRTSTAQERVEVMIEENRLQTIEMVKAAMSMADRMNLEDAKDKIVEAQCLIDDVVPELNNPLIEMLKLEMLQLLTMMRSQELYERLARSFAFSFSSSHDLQRFATRDNVDEFRFFATPSMNSYLQQVKSFGKDPTMPLPTADEE